jgi:hypothetical protein
VSHRLSNSLLLQYFCNVVKRRMDAGQVGKDANDSWKSGIAIGWR